MTENGHEVIVKTITPSFPSGGWPGNHVTIRLWQIYAESGRSRPCTQNEVINFERILGEWKKIKFIRHPTLGEVCCEG